jgi:hypothetical protein
MRKGIAVAVALQSFLVRHVHAAEHQLPSRHQRSMFPRSSWGCCSRW